LQKGAFCTISDSGTITEESSLLKFPAITIRHQHERPEGMDEGILIMSGLRKDVILDAVKVVTQQSNDFINFVDDYDVCNVSAKVVRIIMSYVDYVNRTVWKKYI
jgi:UDP-N-acetylglucosamine 2-epimerase (non-hydrolysing)